MTTAAELVAVWRAAVAACDPRVVVGDAIAEMELKPGPVSVVAIGKAAGAMAAGAVDGLAARGIGIRDGIVVTVDGVGVPETVTGSGLRVRRAGHPVADGRSEAAGREVMELARGVGVDEVMLVLVSGGASALMAVPRDGVTRAEKVARVGEVMRSGAAIGEINRVRGELSAVKGGRLAAMCPGRVVTLVVSDVPGDDVGVVGSGPTVPGKEGDVVRLVAGMETLRRVAATKLGDRVAGSGRRAAGIGPTVGERAGVMVGTVDEVMREVVGVAQRIEAGGAWVAGGEWTVVVTGEGRGGRATHLALMVAREIAGLAGVRVLVAGSDGIDGTGPWAGAVVDGETWARVASEGERGLRECDSGTVLAAVGATITSGPTGVNHADLVIVVRPET